MRHPDDKLLTPLYVKADDDSVIADEPVYYVLSSSGLFLCRRNEFFDSCVAARTWPTELAAHDQTLRLRYPKIRRTQLQVIVGFFATVFEMHGAEAAVVLLWDHAAKRQRIYVPPQRATVWAGWNGRHHPIDIHYDLPDNLCAKFSPIGTIHSHGDGEAYASATDTKDEAYRAGLHIVVGRLSSEPPQFHCEFVVDGTRFRTDLSAVTDGYGERNYRFPRGWLQCVKVDVEHPRNGKDWHTRPVHGNSS